MDTLQLVLQLSGGAIKVPLKKTAQILGIEPGTIRNRKCKGTWPLESHGSDDGGRIYFLANDIANLIDDGKFAVVDSKSRTVSPPKEINRMGASTMAERQAARAAGLTVPEWRAQQQKGR